MNGDDWARIRGWNSERPWRVCVACGKWTQRYPATSPRFCTDPNRCATCQAAAADERFRWLASLSERELAIYVEGVFTGAGGHRDPRLWTLVVFVRDQVGVSV